MSSVIFSAEYDTLGSEKYRDIVGSIETSNVRVSILLQAAQLRFWRLDKKLFPLAIAARNKFIKWVTGLLGRRMTAQNLPSKDIFSYIQEAKDPETGRSFSKTELGAESTTLIVAGEQHSSVVFLKYWNASVRKIY